MVRIDAETLNTIIKAVITLVSVILTTFVVPLIKTKVEAEKLAKIEEYTRLAVRCAEQIFTEEEWLRKKEYVLNYISEKAEELGIDVSAADVENIIEGIVNEVKHGIF